MSRYLQRHQKARNHAHRQKHSKRASRQLEAAVLLVLCRLSFRHSCAAVHRSEVEEGFPAIRRGNSACLALREVGAALLPCVLLSGLGRVEVRLNIFDLHGAVLLGGAAGPGRLAVAPVGQQQLAAVCGDSCAAHLGQVLAVGVEVHDAGEEVETILVEAVRGIEGEVSNRPGASLDSVKSGGDTGLRVQHDVDGVAVVFGVEVLREELHVDFLGIAEVLLGKC